MRVIEGLGEFLQGLLARGPAEQSKLAELPDRVIEIRVGAFDGLVRLADLLLARRASVRVGRGPVRPDRVQHQRFHPLADQAGDFLLQLGRGVLPVHRETEIADATVQQHTLGDGPLMNPFAVEVKAERTRRAVAHDRDIDGAPDLASERLNRPIQCPARGR